MSSDNWHSERSTPMDLGESQGLAQKAQLKNTGQGSSCTNQTGIELFYLTAEALDRQYWGWGRVRNRRLTYLEKKGIVFVLETSRGAMCQSGCPDSTKEVRTRNKRCKHHEDMPGNETKGKGALKQQMGVNMEHSRTEYKENPHEKSEGKSNHSPNRKDGSEVKRIEYQVQGTLLCSSPESCMSTFYSEAHDNDRVIAHGTMLPKQAAFVTHN